MAAFPDGLKKSATVPGLPPAPVKMNLLDNSLDFLREALQRSVAARKDSAHWKFAILCFCQATELALKARLQKDHVALVWARLDGHDAPHRTVTLGMAVDRLSRWCGVPISTSEKAVIERVSEWRNSVTHWEFDLDTKLLQVQLAALLAYLDDFFRLQLDVSLSRRLGRQLWQSVIRLENFADKLRITALKRIESEHPNANVGYCEQCGSDTRVELDETYECYVCGDSGGFFTCNRCGESRPDYERDGSLDLGLCTACVGRMQCADEADEYWRDWRSL
jgi:hypothetical protein